MRESNRKAKPTPADVAAADRLRDIWNAVGKEKFGSQEKFADEIGMTQGGFNQYLGGKVGLNFLATMKIARGLGVPHHRIRNDLPEFEFVAVSQTARDSPSGTWAALKETGWPFKFMRARFNRLDAEQREEIEGVALHLLEQFERRRKRDKIAKRKRDKSHRISSPKAASE